tara:strand:- start:786 stop:1052 length:267 start_codon:yes stop_codon:yes gene_type:complete
MRSPCNYPGCWKKSRYEIWYGVDRDEDGNMLYFCGLAEYVESRCEEHVKSLKGKNIIKLPELIYELNNRGRAIKIRDDLLCRVETEKA